MSRLERWMPFKFARKDNEKKAPATTGAVEPFGTFFGAPFNSMLQALFDEAPFGAIDSERFFGDFSPAKFRPTIDVVDEETSLRVTAELPGMKKKDIQLELHDDMLTLRGEKTNREESKENGVFRTERYYGAFHRNIPLPADVKVDAATADFEDGVLTIRVPKMKDGENKAKKVEIR